MSFANINHAWGGLIIEELSRLGADYFCLSPGSRSSPLAMGAAQNKKASSIVHFDERGLAFHAMGYSAAAGKPAVLICTSGTAAANFFPAVIEASKKKLPLIVLTADRPPELRQTGAVQTIDQAGLFGKYAAWALDMPCPDLEIAPAFVLTTIDQAWHQATHHKAPVHINCMFRPPLACARTSDDIDGYLRPLENWMQSTKPYTTYLGAEPASLPQAQDVVRRLQGIKQGLIVVGKMEAGAESLVPGLAKTLGWPVFADAASGLRFGHADAPLICYFDPLLLNDRLCAKLDFDGVLHLGGRLTSQRYYDFIKRQQPAEYIMVLNHALRNDPNHQVTWRVQAPIGHFIQGITKHLKPRKPSVALRALSAANTKADGAIENFLNRDERLSEPRVARLVSQWIPEGHGLFLGNSMPVRDMGNYGDFKGAAVRVNGNRGASGIDGLIASAAGYAAGLRKPVTLMIGDLSALHDLNSLAMLRDVAVPFVIVVLNNGGGAIFSFLPIAEFKEGFEKFWGTPHPYTLEGAASMFELNYSRPMNGTQFKKAYTEALKMKTSTILEVVTSREENLKLHQSLQDHIVKSIEKV